MAPVCRSRPGLQSAPRPGTGITATAAAPGTLSLALRVVAAPRKHARVPPTPRACGQQEAIELLGAQLENGCAIVRRDMVRGLAEVVRPARARPAVRYDPARRAAHQPSRRRGKARSWHAASAGPGFMPRASRNRAAQVANRGSEGALAAVSMALEDRAWAAAAIVGPTFSKRRGELSHPHVS